MPTLLRSYVISYTVKTLRLTVASPSATLGGEAEGGAWGRGIWGIVRTSEKNPGYTPGLFKTSLLGSFLLRRERPLVAGKFKTRPKISL